MYIISVYTEYRFYNSDNLSILRLVSIFKNYVCFHNDHQTTCFDKEHATKHFGIALNFIFIIRK